MLQPPVSKWFDRKFDFSFLVEQWPNLCSRLRGTPVRLADIMSDAPRVILTSRRDHKWSAQENAGHLLALEPLWIARVDDFLGDQGTLTAADLSNRATDDANYNAQSLDEILAAFRAARGQLTQKLNGIDPQNFTRTLLHPRLKQPMRLVDHLYFVAEHDDHHLAVISDLIFNPDRPSTMCLGFPAK